MTFSIDGCSGRKTTAKRRKDGTDTKNITGIREPWTEVSPRTTLYFALLRWFTEHLVHPVLEARQGCLYMMLGQKLSTFEKLQNDQTTPGRVHPWTPLPASSSRPAPEEILSFDVRLSFTPSFMTY